ncbi:type II secretion system protein [Halobacteriales archaeon QS_1_67_19]|nr:MAG: type II secretion system protein [Halobacteriales archaeon QS_1_67_19]
MLAYLPLLLVVAALVPLALAPLDRRIDRFLTHLALTAFGDWVAEKGRRRAKRRGLLQAIHVGETYRMYAAKTILYATAAALAGSVLGVYLVAAVMVALSISPETMRAYLPAQLHFLASELALPLFTLGELFVVLLAGSLGVGVLAGGLTYWLRWETLSYRAKARERQIDESIVRTVAFVYALSRSGMPFPEITRTLARNRSVYGAAAEEVAVAVKAMDYAGMDMVSAIERLADRTPSEKFGEFADNLASVLRSGQTISAYLEGQYERYQKDAEAQQESFLELLATLAEGYVTLFVVAPLLFITILVIMGLMALGDTLPLLRVIAYFAIPLANVGVVIYLDSITESVRPTREHRAVDLGDATLAGLRRTDDPDADRAGIERPGAEPSALRSDGGARTAGLANFERLAAFERVRWLRETFGDPIATLRDDPASLLSVTVPLGLLSIVVRAWPHLADGTLTVRALDDLVAQAVLFVVGTFALVQELHRRRIEAIEAAVPDFLDRFASVNEAGMSVVESLGRVTESDLGALDPEVRKLWADVQWGVDVETALYRFEDRLDTPTITRVVTLIANAMAASGDLARVLRIAADEAQDNRRLKRKRKQEMLTYVVIIYVSFVVFLVIVAALNSILIPNLPTGASAPAQGGTNPVGGGGPLSSISSVNVDAYTLLFFHTALIQALFSGLLAGQMGEGNVKNGAKHATVLLTVAYAAFLLLP